jgi:serine O-acetyltransferase
MWGHLRAHWNDHDRDWTRLGFYALVVYRFGRWRYTLRPILLRKPFSLMYKVARVLATMLCGIEIPCEVTIGKGFVIEHSGAIVISGDAIFGDHCVIRQGVTVGLRHRGQRGSPIIGDRVDIGAGAKLLGKIRIGNDVSIGANAVVLCDVPDGCTAVGVPARVLPPRSMLKRMPVEEFLPLQ